MDHTSSRSKAGSSEEAFSHIGDHTSNSLVFSDTDKQVSFNHNRPFYLTGTANGLEFKRMFIDGGSALNIVPTSRLKLLRIPESRDPIYITGIGCESRKTLGYLVLALQIGKIRIPATFHIIDADPTYHLLLGRSWNSLWYGLVLSTYHQCFKA